MSIFSKIPLPKIPRSTHNLSHSFRMTGDFGVIYPCMTELAFAGDSWFVDLEQFVRSMPMIAPVMDMVDVKVDAFFCPIRLLWDDFEDWVTLGPTGEASFDWPTIFYDLAPSGATARDSLKKIFATGGLADYLNYPTDKVNVVVGTQFVRELDALPFRMYQTVYNEYYRNENLEDEIPVGHASGRTNLATGQSGSDAYRNFSNFFLRKRGWNKDYFTSALPWPQKGPQVRLPQSDVVLEPDGRLRVTAESAVHATGSSLVERIDEVHPIFSLPLAKGDNNIYDSSTSSSLVQTYNDDNQDSVMMFLKYKGGIKASAVDLPTIEELRYTECLQEFYEANARGGSRPKEYYRNIWHTNTKDARLDRPEYLGGYRGPITISDVDQTSESDISAQATPAGKGISAGGNKVIRYHCSEHGYIMVCISITPRSSYYQGFRKMNLYRDVFDFPNPFFANLGEQEIKNLELYDDPSDNKNDETFGYTPRYAEAKFIPSTVHGQLRSTLNYWTLTRKFDSRPNLNSAFVHIDPSEGARIFPTQVSDNDKFIISLYFHVKRRMYLPYWGIPRLIHSI